MSGDVPLRLGIPKNYLNHFQVLIPSEPKKSRAILILDDAP